MKKHLVYRRVDEICSKATYEEEKTDNLLYFWGELNGSLEKQYFIDRIFKQLGHFPKEIYENEALLNEVGECNTLQEILDASRRKNKPIK